MITEAINPCSNLIAVTPHDTNDLAHYSRWIYVGSGGNMRVTAGRDSASVLIENIPDGSQLPLVVTRIWATDLTAGDIVVGY